MLRAGVDLGGTKIQTVIVADDHEVRGQDRRPTPHDAGPAGVTSSIADSVRATLSDANLDPGQLVGVGVGAPGQIDHFAGTVSHAGNLPDWSGTFALGTELSRQLSTPVQLGNDVQVAVRGEAELGAGAGYDSFLGVFLGTGVGGGVVIHRELWIGRGAAGEIGHTVVDMNGPQCPCGRRGCLEAYAGRAAMEAAARRRRDAGEETILFDIMEAKGKTRATSGVWAKALKKKDHMTVDLLDSAVVALGQAIGSAVNLLDPDAIVIGGGLGIRLGKPFTERIEEAAIPRMVMGQRAPDFRVAALGDLGGALGASLLAGAGA